ncbi:hypothetical protein [Marinicella litoralis]|uniref:Uncharacterized protein n=1 Tax=Marinicella litoralis TaxID=644220 RepID=A0A4R6XTQ2_9GAMM|nr:hypothetical protein [Marinicella litoralis]TDR23342.1 hypothetical protein C8D91_0202 [Marinicella litoralis]
MLKISPYLIIISFVLLIVSFSKRNDFTDDLNVLVDLMHDPKQTPVNLPPFFTSYNEEDFEIMPKYDYELNGLVVSYRLHDADGGTMLHALSKDHLNVADFCVVWGDTAQPGLLREFDFSNGQFTCSYGTQSSAAWNAFNETQLSNNHLLAIDDAVRDTISEVNIGDQINIKGWLAHYKNPLGYERGTSTSRNDRGDGACETIFVKEISILQPMKNQWRSLMSFAFGVLLISLFLYFKAPYEPHRR